MRRPNRWWILLLAFVLAAASGCTEGNLDDSDASVILEILGIDNPPVTENVGLGTCTGNPAIECLDSQICADNLAGSCDFSSSVCEIREWSVNVKNAPLNAAGAVSPFNDIEVSSVMITYKNVNDEDYLPAPSTRSVPTNGTIPAGGTGTLTFFPIAFDDIGPDNTTVNLTLNFTAQTVSGEAVDIAGANGAQLVIEDCIP